MLTLSQNLNHREINHNKTNYKPSNSAHNQSASKSKEWGRLYSDSQLFYLYSHVNNTEDTRKRKRTEENVWPKTKPLCGLQHVPPALRGATAACCSNRMYRWSDATRLHAQQEPGAQIGPSHSLTMQRSPQRTHERVYIKVCSCLSVCLLDWNPFSVSTLN